jgi:hypothetical protein
VLDFAAWTKDPNIVAKTISTVYRLLKLGIITYFRLGGHGDFRFAKTAIDDWIEYGGATSRGRCAASSSGSTRTAPPRFLSSGPARSPASSYPRAELNHPDSMRTGAPPASRAEPRRLALTLALHSGQGHQSDCCPRDNAASITFVPSTFPHANF